MAVNQSPEYKKAEERYRAAAAPAEKLHCLEEMLRLVPKHKSSEKLQSQLKQKIKTARTELQQPKRHGSGPRDLFAVSKQGAGQVVLLGACNVGKSAIVRALTDAKVEVAAFPFSTHTAIPGYIYGGLIASLIDCHSTGSAAIFAMQEAEVEIGSEPSPRFLTAHLFPRKP